MSRVPTDDLTSPNWRGARIIETINGQTTIKEVPGGPVIAGGVSGFPIPEDMPAEKGAVVIEWPCSSPTSPANLILPGIFTSVWDRQTGELIPASKITVNVNCPGYITADIAVFLDAQGEIIHDPRAIERDAVGTPVTYTFRVAGMRNSGDSRDWK